MTDFKTQEDLDIFLLNGGRVQFHNWSRRSPTFMFMELDRKVYYGNDDDRDYRFVKPVALDYRQVRIFIPVVEKSVVLVPWWSSLDSGCKWLVFAVVVTAGLHIVRAIGGF